MAKLFPRSTTLCLLALLFLSLTAAVQPVSVKEVCLMLRGGYTGDEVLREISTRPLLDPIDAGNEQLLRAAGADARLVAALKTARRASPADTPSVSAPAYPPPPRFSGINNNTAAPAAPTPTPGPLDKVAGQLHNQLVIYKDGHWQAYDDSTLANKKLFALYFASQSNAQCRLFTPRLVDFYRDFAPKHPSFELVFFSTDATAAEMEDDVRQNAMPWPVIAFEREALQTSLIDMARQGVPRLMLIDGAARLVSDTFSSGKYIGPQRVLDDLTHLADTAAKNSANANPNLTPAHAPTAAATPTPAADPLLIDKQLRGKLVHYANGAFVPYNLDPLERKKVIALYFSSYVSAAGRQFSPELVKFYQRTAAAHPEFEVVVVSGDKSVYNMERLVTLANMPFPAVSYDQIGSVPMFKALAYLGGASRMAVFNNQGQFLADYSIALPNPNVANVLDDLTKVIADPTHPSALAPPHAAVPE